MQQHLRPSPSWRAIQGWLNQTATSGPLSSNTRASTRLRRRSRIGLTVTPAHRHRDGRLLPHAQLPDQPHVAAVAVGVREVLDQVSPGGDAEPLERPWGRRSARRAGSAWGRSGPGRRRAAAPSRRTCGLYSAQSSHHHAGCPPSWYSTSTPSGARLHGGAVERRLLARDAGEQLGAVGDLRERGRERLGRVAPGDQLAAGVPDRLAGGEASLGVVARRRRHAAQAQRHRRLVDDGLVGVAALGRVEREQRGQALLRRRGRDHPRGLLGQLRRALGRQDHVGAVGQHQHLGPGAAWMPASSS